MKVNSKHIAQRKKYIRILLDNRSKSVLEKRLEVYTDESYIHHPHRLNYHSLYHPSMRKSIGKDPKKGRRICFVAAICGERRTTKPGLILKSLWHFTPNSAKGHKSDYYNVFNSETS